MKKTLIKKLDSAQKSIYLETDKNIIYESLKEDINDLEAYNLKKGSLIKRLNFIAKAIDNRASDEKLLERAAEALFNGIKIKDNKPISILKELLQNKPSLVLYKNLDHLTIEVIADIIRDINLVELLEQLENNDKDH